MPRTIGKDLYASLVPLRVLHAVSTGSNVKPSFQMSHSLNSLKGGYMGDYIGYIIGVIKGDTRSLDHGSNAME